MIDKRTSTLGVVLCFLLTAIFGYFVGKYVKPNTIVSHIDTVSVVTKIDSARIANSALIQAQAVIAQYDITDTGEWILRKPKKVYVKGDTVFVDTTETTAPIQVATLDTTLLNKQDSIQTTDHLNLKYAFEIGALLFEYDSYMVDQGDTSFYKLKLKGSYLNGNWKVMREEEWNVKKKTTIITRDVYIQESLTFWNRFIFGPTVSLGYGVFSKQLDTFVGFGIMYNLR